MKVVYNVFVTLGVLSIFWGEGSPYFLLEIPASVGGGLGLCFLLITVWTILDYCRRKRRSAFISQHYILGAVFWLAWTFSISPTPERTSRSLSVSRNSGAT